jgi:hypothetical protein
MPDCPCLVRCSFLNGLAQSKPATAELTKRRLCRASYRSCARYLVFEALGRSQVPDDLHPDQMERARTTLWPERDRALPAKDSAPRPWRAFHSGAFPVPLRASRPPRRTGSR